MAVETFLVRTMSDTAETDIQRVHVIANEILPRYGKPTLTFEQLRKVADGPFDLFLIPLIWADEFEKDRNLPFNEAKRVEIRGLGLERGTHGYDVNHRILSGPREVAQEPRRQGCAISHDPPAGALQHQAMEKACIVGCFEEIVDREETLLPKEQGPYYLFATKPRTCVSLSQRHGEYIKAGNNAHCCQWGTTFLELFRRAINLHSYNDEATLRSAQPKAVFEPTMSTRNPRVVPLR